MGEHDVTQKQDPNTGSKSGPQIPDPHKLPSGTKPPEQRPGGTKSSGGNN